MRRQEEQKTAMKICLINPGVASSHQGTIPEVSKAPLGLGFLASWLIKHGHDVSIVDEIACQDAVDCIAKRDYGVIGISGMTMFANRMYEIADWAREHTASRVVLGGAHASALPNEAIQHAHHVIVGEAENAFLEVVESDSKEKIVSGEPIKNIDDIPLPARDLMDIEFYLRQRDQIAGMDLKTLSIITSRGCPFECIFCANSKRKVPVRFHSAERVIAEISHLKETYGIEGLAFTDDCFTMHKKRLAAICEGMIAAGLDDIVWECQTRGDQLDQKTIDVMQRAGCKQVGIGFESGSQRVLDIINKNTTVKQNRRAVDLLHDAKLRVRGCFVVGVPGETKKDIELTEAFIDSNKIDFVSFFILTPYPGTKLWDYCQSHTIPLKDLDYWRMDTGNDPQVACNPNMSLDEIVAVHARLTTKYSLKNYSPLQLCKRAIRYPHITAKYAWGALSSMNPLKTATKPNERG